MPVFLLIRLFDITMLDILLIIEAVVLLLSEEERRGAQVLLTYKAGNLIKIGSALSSCSMLDRKVGHEIFTFL